MLGQMARFLVALIAFGCLLRKGGAELFPARDRDE
jgi:hypothetical protein